MMFAQHRAGVHVVVHHHPELAASFERHREHVHALVGEQTADARQRARTVRKTETELGADSHSDSLRYRKVKSEK